MEKGTQGGFRAERSRSKQTGGTGLGLAITKSIVEVHGGSITAHSSKKVTFFETRFPLDNLTPPYKEVTMQDAMGLSQAGSVPPNK